MRRNSLALKSHRGRRAGHAHSGVPQEPARPGRLRAWTRTRVTGLSNPLACKWRRSVTGRSEPASARAVPPSEGNEVRRDGRQGVGAPRSTAEAGEPTRRDPVEGRGRRIAERL